MLEVRRKLETRSTEEAMGWRIDDLKGSASKRLEAPLREQTEL